MSIALTCHQLSKAFGDQIVVDNVSFHVHAGQILALLGPSGCGKTTTLRLIAGFEQLDQGQIDIDGQRVADGAGRHTPTEKRRIGMVFQDYAIFPHLSVADNVAFGLRRGRARKERADAMLDFVGMAGQGTRMPHELSGGQQQRVALARALAPEPAVLLLDEPFSNLDAALRAAVRHEVHDLLKKSGTTAVFVTHDQEEALFMGDQVAIMNEGRLEQLDTPETLYHHPSTRFVADFVGQTDFMPAVVSANGVETPLGPIVQPIELAPGVRVEIAVRPDDIRLFIDGTPNAIVIARQFIGIAFIYRLQLNDGSIVNSLQPHTLRVEIGAPVRAVFRGDHSLPLFPL